MAKLLNSVSYVHKMFSKLSSTQQAIEWYKCKTNPFYFIFNYAFIPEIGGVLKYEDEIMGGKIKRFVRSIARYHKCLFMASRQLGKALDINTPIPVLFGGYKLLKDLNIGDYIFDECGNPTQIIATTDIMYNRPCYKINFDNNESIIADENHLWKISNSTCKFKDQIKTTKEIFEIETNSYIILSNNNILYIKSITPIESVPVKCIQVSNLDGMFLCGESMMPTHNSTIASCMLEWACNFYPYVPATILNANKGFALENIEKVKFIHSNLPTGLRTPLKYKGERKTTMEYVHGSIIR